MATTLCLISFLVFIFVSSGHSFHVDDEDNNHGIMSTSMTRHSVIVIPGFGASLIDVKLDRRSLTTDWTTISWSNMSKYLKDEEFKRIYDRKTRRTTNPEGVETRISKWGDSYTLKSMSKLVTALEEVGYKKGIDILSAPYDYRLSSNEMEDYFTRLVTMVEDTYAQNGNKPMIIISHALGCLHTYYFLKNTDKLWKKKYVKSWIGLSCRFGGTIHALKNLADGGLMSTFPSTYYMLPDSEVWMDSTIMMVNDGQKERTYSSKNMIEIFQLLNNTNGYQVWTNTRDIFHGYQHPEVEVHCVTEIKRQTTHYLRYRSKNFSISPEIIQGGGLETYVCDEWTRDSTLNLTSTSSQFDHDVLYDDNAVNYIIGLISDINGPHAMAKKKQSTAWEILGWWLVLIIVIPSLCCCVCCFCIIYKCCCD